MSKKHQRWSDLGLLDMGIDDMCEQLDITQEEVLERFNERTIAYQRRIETGIERDFMRGSIKDEEEEYTGDIYTDFDDIDKGRIL